MSLKSLFTEKEWESIIQSPMLAGLAVTAADPSGLWGTIKEASATASSVVRAKDNTEAGALAQEIGEAFTTSEGRGIAQDGVKALLRGKKPAEAAQEAVRRLGEIAALVSAKSPEAAAAYKDFLKATAQHVAEAGTEGGFLGFGGEKVSDAEKQTLEDIDRVLA